MSIYRVSLPAFAVLLAVQGGPRQLGGPLALVEQRAALLLQEQELLQQQYKRAGAHSASRQSSAGCQALCQGCPAWCPRRRPSWQHAARCCARLPPQTCCCFSMRSRCTADSTSLVNSIMLPSLQCCTDLCCCAPPAAPAHLAIHTDEQHTLAGVDPQAAEAAGLGPARGTQSGEEACPSSQAPQLPAPASPCSASLLHVLCPPVSSTHLSTMTAGRRGSSRQDGERRAMGGVRGKPGAGPAHSTCLLLLHPGGVERGRGTDDPQLCGGAPLCLSRCSRGRPLPIPLPFSLSLDFCRIKIRRFAVSAQPPRLATVPVNGQ